MSPLKGSLKARIDKKKICGYILKAKPKPNLLQFLQY
jgi:hypothetical protein